MPPELEPYDQYREYPLAEMEARARDFRREISRRRSVRDFSPRPVPRTVVEECLRAAGSAPSGANMQPWTFVAVSDPRLKREIRRGAEKEEREFYRHRASEEWLEALAPLGTDEEKPFLETAPWLIVVFGQVRGRDAAGRPVKHYYVNESVGLATGFLIAALHHAGLATLTHTPSPMRFLNRILDRPQHDERPFLVLVVGYPAEGVEVPRIRRKELEEFAVFR